MRFTGSIALALAVVAVLPARAWTSPEEVRLQESCEDRVRRVMEPGWNVARALALDSLVKECPEEGKELCLELVTCNAEALLQTRALRWMATWMKADELRALQLKHLETLPHTALKRLLRDAPADQTIDLVCRALTAGRAVLDEAAAAARGADPQAKMRLERAFVAGVFRPDRRVHYPVAIRLIEALASVRFVPWLMRVAADGKEEVWNRAAAVRALGAARDSRAVPLLRKLARSEAAYRVGGCRRVTVRLGEDATEALAKIASANAHARRQP
ncbi:MAG: hypothetical protein HY816_01745 [Candidatus Wallbacteria bacterium]|nr:hypothetical protein [Candidatus Wallbacteria bacterium]